MPQIVTDARSTSCTWSSCCARLRLAEDAAAAGAWVRTFIETQAVEDFTFDPDGDSRALW